MNLKKIFLLFVLAIAGIVVAQAQGYMGVDDRSQDGVEEAFVKGIIQGMDEELSSLSDKETGMRYDGTSVEGKNIICRVTVDESRFGGMPITAAFKMLGVDEQSFGQMMREELYSQTLTADERAGLEMLRDYGYKIYFCLVGSQSGEKMNCLVDYESML